MEIGIISKQDLGSLFSKLTNDYKIFIPQKKDEGFTLVEYNPEQKIELGYKNMILSSKSNFFPQREIVCTFCKDTISQVPEFDETYLIFGVRPCDSRAVTQLDLVFSKKDGKYKDPYYMNRRKNSLIISVACNNPAPTCFCTTTGGGPSDETGSDIIAYELEGDELFLKSCTKAGFEFMSKNSDILSSPDDSHLSQLEENQRKALDKLQSIDINGLKETLDKEFEDEIWESLTQSCIGCGACTYLCPTCHCFDITDETNNEGSGARIRSWDSCQYPLFTHHASGHNPRPKKSQRMRQRIMHKFSYTVENFDSIFCVGCGRCVIHCPVNLDIREMLKTLQ